MSDHRVNQAAEKRASAFHFPNVNKCRGMGAIACRSDSYEGVTRCIFPQPFFYSPGHTPVCRRLSRGAHDGKSGPDASSGAFYPLPQGLRNMLHDLRDLSYGLRDLSHDLCDLSYGLRDLSHDSCDRSQGLCDRSQSLCDTSQGLRDTSQNLCDASFRITYCSILNK
jgi:hypothetical protein